MNGEGSVRIDRGHWLYRFVLDNNVISIYRSPRAGQHLAQPEVWRTLALLGISDAFVVRASGGWQPFVELSDGRERWALAARPTLAEAEQEVGYFLVTMANAIEHSTALAHEAELKPARATGVIPARDESSVVEKGLAQEKAAREEIGWELIYTRQRASH